MESKCEFTSIRTFNKRQYFGVSGEFYVYLPGVWIFYMHRTRAILAIFFTSLCPFLYGQLDNRSLEFENEITEKDSGAVFFSLKSLGYLRNNEFFNEIADGLTLFGFQLQPTVAFFPHKNVRIDAGVYLRQDFGEANFTDVQAVVSLKYHKKNFDLIFGTLEGAYSHRLIEPLYGFERGLTNRPEYGIQLRYINETTFSDFWINWERALFPGDSSQEEIFGGLSLNHKWVATNTWEVATPLQVIIFHRGGQIDVSDAPLVTQMNYALGLHLARKFNFKWLNRIYTENYFTGFNDNSGNPDSFEDGFGVFLNLGADLNRLNFLASYWYGEEFIGIQGGDIYQTVSRRVGNNMAIETPRQLLFFRFFYDIPLVENVDISVRFEPHLDLESDELEYSAGFYVRFTTDIFLLKVKSR